jgi:hypothetical protein
MALVQRLLLLLSFALCVATSRGTTAHATDDTFRTQVQTLMDSLAAKHHYALQFGWYYTGNSIALASGTLPATAAAATQPSPGRAITPTDTFLFGSGTKPYTAAAVLKLFASKHISMDAKAAPMLDPLLQRMNQTTLVALFGPKAADITVAHLLRMQSGIADFDVPAFDDEVLKAGQAVWSPYAFIEAAAQQTPSFLCDPGNCTTCAWESVFGGGGGGVYMVIQMFGGCQPYPRGCTCERACVRVCVCGHEYLRLLSVPLQPLQLQNNCSCLPPPPTKPPPPPPTHNPLPADSSTNFELAGLVLLAAQNVASWTHVNQSFILPSDATGPACPSTQFLSTGALNTQGLTVPGQSGGGFFHKKTTAIFAQDASILG